MAKTPQTAVATETVPTEIDTGIPAYLQGLEEYGGAGISTDSADFQLPFLAIAQSNSPQLKKQQADVFIPGMEAGDIFNTATRRYWKGAEGVLVCPAHFQKAVVEWVPRTAGGGYVATHPPDTQLMSLTKKSSDGRMNLLANGHQLVETNYHFVIEQETEQPMIIGLTSTGIGVSRNWMTLMKQFHIPTRTGKVVAPSFARVYRLTTVYKKNDEGDWFQLQVADEGWAPSTLVQPAKEFWLENREHGFTLGRPPVANIEGSAAPQHIRDSAHDDQIPI